MSSLFLSVHVFPVSTQKGNVSFWQNVHNMCAQLLNRRIFSFYIHTGCGAEGALSLRGLIKSCCSPLADIRLWGVTGKTRICQQEDKRFKTKRMRLRQSASTTPPAHMFVWINFCRSEPLNVQILPDIPDIFFFFFCLFCFIYLFYLCATVYLIWGLGLLHW